MTDPHHDAAHHHQRGGGETVFLGAQQRRHYHVAAGLQLAVGLDDDAIAQLVLHQYLLGLCQAEFPGHTGMFERGQR